MAKNHGKKDKKHVSPKEAKRIANKEITLRDFNPTYDQILKRASTAIKGLKCGSEPGVAGP